MKTRTTGPRFLDLMDDEGDLEKAGVVILPLPYERTSSYVHGSFRGPTAVLEASAQLEEHDEELGVEIYRSCNGIATLEPMPLQIALQNQIQERRQRGHRGRDGRWLCVGRCGERRPRHCPPQPANGPVR